MKWPGLSSREELAKVREALQISRAQYAEEQRSRSALEISNASLQRENELLRGEMTKALDNERYALRTMVNFNTQANYGVKAYPGNPGLPDNIAGEPAAPQEPARLQGLDMVNRSNHEFLEQARDRVKRGEHLPIPIEQLETMLFNR